MAVFGVSEFKDRQEDGMEYYKILLVDDELEIRDGMIQKLDWHQLGYDVAAAAENGVEALEKADQVQPDVIMTDIRMPFMDGLEFIEKVIERLPAVKIIVFSGFDDFEYAQKAINLGVEEYILKPISARQLEESLIKLKKKMDEELARKRDIAILRRSYEESFPILREQFFISMIEGRMTPRQIEVKMNQYGLSLSARHKTVAVLSANENSLSFVRKNVFAGEEELSPIAIKRTAEDIIGKYHEMYSFLYLNYVVLIVALEWESQISLLCQEVNEACKAACRITDADVTAGIGGIYGRFEELKYSFEEAQNALEYSTLLRKEGRLAAYIKDMEPEDTTARLQLEEQDERLLMNAVKSNNMEKAQKQISRFFERLEQARLPFCQYQMYILEIFTVLMKLVNVYQLDTNVVFKGASDYIEAVLGLHSLEEIKDWFIQACRQIGTLIQKERMASGKMLVEKARQYVDENYADAEFSVETLCESLHISPAYFSTIFKKEAGINFISYLTDVRMKEAMRLLDETDEKTYMIAAKVGYSEPNYFSYAFKKQVGVSPSRYRKGLRDQQ